MAAGCDEFSAYSLFTDVVSIIAFFEINTVTGKSVNSFENLPQINYRLLKYKALYLLELWVKVFSQPQVE